MINTSINNIKISGNCFANVIKGRNAPPSNHTMFSDRLKLKSCASMNQLSVCNSFGDTQVSLNKASTKKLMRPQRPMTSKHVIKHNNRYRVQEGQEMMIVVNKLQVSSPTASESFFSRKNSKKLVKKTVK